MGLLEKLGMRMLPNVSTTLLWFANVNCASSDVKANTLKHGLTILLYYTGPSDSVRLLLPHMYTNEGYLRGQSSRKHKEQKKKIQENSVDGEISNTDTYWRGSQITAILM